MHRLPVLLLVITLCGSAHSRIVGPTPVESNPPQWGPTIHGESQATQQQICRSCSTPVTSIRRCMLRCGTYPGGSAATTRPNARDV